MILEIEIFFGQIKDDLHLCLYLHKNWINHCFPDTGVICISYYTCRATALAILAHKDWKDTLRVCVQNGGNIISPMRMLIESMPGTLVVLELLQRIT